GRMLSTACDCARGGWRGGGEDLSEAGPGPAPVVARGPPRHPPAPPLRPRGRGRSLAAALEVGGPPGMARAGPRPALAAARGARVRRGRHVLRAPPARG